MKTYDEIIHILKDNMRAEPGGGLRDLILDSAGAAEPSRVKRRVSMNAVLAAAVIVVLSLTTAFAYGEAIMTFMFGDSIAAQVHKIDSDSDAVVRFRIVNESALASHIGNGLHEFDTVEEADQFGLMPVKAPDYLPENVTGLERVSIGKAEWGAIAVVTYRVEAPNRSSLLSIHQHYAGPDAYVELETIYAIQKIMIGGVEASVVYDEHEDETQIYWIKDDVLLILYSGKEYDLETLLAIAESV
jgi:hypothetical protein